MKSPIVVPIFYWEQKVAFQTPASRTYSVQIQHANRRAWIGLHTASKAEAAFEARKLYVELKANGWEETLRRRRKPDAPKMYYYKPEDERGSEHLFYRERNGTQPKATFELLCIMVEKATGKEVLQKRIELLHTIGLKWLEP